MTSACQSFDTFREGDHFSFRRRFGKADFAAFARLSGDVNRLHHDPAYAAASEFGRPIVPLHLTAAPLSAIAGMAFPGEPALYLGHEMRAVAPVFYGDTVTYSARIVAINHSHQVLSLQVIAFVGDTVVLHAELRVRWRKQPGDTVPWQTLRHDDDRWAVITGAGGAIGGATARRLADAGWNLVLHGRRPPQAPAGRGKMVCVGSDLATAAGRRALSRIAARHGAVALVHAASPSVLAPVNTLTAVNHTALVEVSRSMVPAMLGRQWGAIVLVGSQAVHTTPDGWEDYAGAKAMAGQWIESVNHRWGAWGLAGITVAPGYVEGEFSRSLRPAGVECLLPEEVAETIVARLEERSAVSDYIMLEPGRQRHGRMTFIDRGARVGATPAPPGAVVPVPPVATPEFATDGDLATVVKDFLRLPASTDLDQGGLGRTPGWDSLRHIELLLHLERYYAISFSADDMANTGQFSTLAGLCRAKLAQAQGKTR